MRVNRILSLFSLSVTFLVLTVDQFVGHDDGPLEQQKQDSHVRRRNCVTTKTTKSKKLRIRNGILDM